MIRFGVVVPVHDEVELLPACLEAIADAARGLDVTVVVVLDSCSDGSLDVCRLAAVPHLELQVRSAGAARAAGFAWLLEQLGTDDVWLASTDADSTVAPDWFQQQDLLAAAGADAVFGVVDVVEWRGHLPEVEKQFRLSYTDADVAHLGPHPHRHGACFGVRATTYVRAGGMPELSVGEDHALAERLDRLPDTTLVASTAMRVTTSSRPRSRVEGGFASYLRALA